MDETFEKIQNDAITEAQAVKCSLTEYVSGLETMMDTLRSELDAARESAQEEEPEPDELEEPEE